MCLEIITFHVYEYEPLELVRYSAIKIFFQKYVSCTLMLQRLELLERKILCRMKMTVNLFIE